MTEQVKKPPINKEILKEIRSIELQAKKIVNSPFLGEYRSHFKRRGMDFTEVRQYVPGDDVRSIDWKVTARMNLPYIKVYHEERELVSMIIFDGSKSNDFGTMHHTKAQIGTRVAATLAFSAIKNNDKVGLIIFTDIIEAYIPPQKGRKHVLRIIREILFFRTLKKGTNIPLVTDYLHKVHKKKGIIFFVSDFLPVKQEVIDAMKILNTLQDLIAIRIYDRREVSMPQVGFISLEDLETGQQLLINTSSKAFQSKVLEQKTSMNDLKQAFRRLKIDFIDLHADDLFLNRLIQFFKK